MELKQIFWELYWLFFLVPNEMVYEKHLPQSRYSVNVSYPSLFPLSVAHNVCLELESSRTGVAEGEERWRPPSAGGDPSSPEGNGTNTTVSPQGMLLAVFKQKVQSEQCL